MSEIVSTLAQIALHHLWQSAAIAAAAFVVLAGSRSASLRAWALTGAFALTALAPIAAFLPGATLLSGAILTDGVAASEPAVPRLVTNAGSLASEEGATGAEMALPITEPIADPGAVAADAMPAGLAAVFVVLWVAGAIFGLARLGRAWIASRSLRARAAPLDPADERVGGEQFARLPIRISADVASPMVVGVLNPAVLIPASDAFDLSRAEMAHILRHESAHLARLDPQLGFVQRVISALFWWNPVVQLLSVRLDAARELACDERAALTAADGAGYARALISGARAAAGARAPLLATGALGPRAHIETRLRRLGHPDFARHARATISSCAVAAAALTFGAALIAAATPRMALAWQEPVADRDVDVESDGAAWDVVVSDDEDGSWDVVVSDDEDGSWEAVVREGDEASWDVAVAPDPTRPWTAQERALGNALVGAAEDGEFETIAALIQAGAPIDYATDGDGTALIIASRGGDTRLVDFLIEAGADVNIASPGDGNALINAAARGHLGIARRLLAAGAHVDAFVEGDETPLINAAARREPGMVELLVENGADVSLGFWVDTMRGGALVREWRSPMSVARRHGRAEVVDFLAARGAVEGP